VIHVENFAAVIDLLQLERQRLDVVISAIEGLATAQTPELRPSHPAPLPIKRRRRSAIDQSVQEAGQKWLEERRRNKGRQTKVSLEAPVVAKSKKNTPKAPRQRKTQKPQAVNI
jgi:hypothetical protein